MRTLVFLALCLVAAASAKNYFYNMRNVRSAERPDMGGQHIRSLYELREYLGLSDHFTFQVEASRKSSSGVLRQRLRLYFKGLPVRVATLQASQNEYGSYTGSVTGLFPRIPDNFDVSVSNSHDARMQALIDYVNQADFVPGAPLRVEELKNFHSEKQIHMDTGTGDPMVVYYVSGLVDRSNNIGAYIRYPRALIKAGVTMEVVTAILPVQKGKDKKKCKNRECPAGMGGNEKVPGPVYGAKCNQVCLNTPKKGDKCVLANSRVNVKDLNMSWNRNNAEVVSFDCEAGLQDGMNGAYSSASDAFYYSQIFYDVLEYWAGLDSTNREPHTLFVNFGDYYSNSFWDGQSTTFGAGTDLTYPFATAEVIGHEMGHAFTDALNNLVFDEEAEAISEGFADICGKAVTYYLYGAAAGWDFGAAVLRDPNQAIRYFDDPTRDQVSIASYNDLVEGTNKYSAMGIILKAFYSIVEVKRVAFKDAFEAFVVANQIYWNEETSFVDGACGVVRAAVDIGLNANDFMDGFRMVDIDLDGHCSLGGNMDTIRYNGDIETRHAQISLYRSASYYVQADDDRRYVRVTISGRGDNTVTIKSLPEVGREVTSNERSVSLRNRRGMGIELTADSAEALDITVTFEYEERD